MADIHKELVQLIKEVDRDLGGVYDTLTKFQKDLMKVKPPKSSKDDGGLTLMIKALNSATSSLIRQLENEKDALSTLRRSPPGWFSSVVDFIYSVSVNPKPQSQKEDYYKKLKELDKTVNKEFVSLESMLDLPESQVDLHISNQIDTALRVWNDAGILRPDTKQFDFKNNMFDLVKGVLESRKSVILPTTVQSLLVFLRKSFTNSNVAGQALINFTNALKKEFHNIAHESYKKIVLAEYPIIEKAVATVVAASQVDSHPSPPEFPSELQASFDLSKIVTASTNLASVVSNYRTQLQNYKNKATNQNWAQKVERVLEKVSPNEKRDKMKVIQTYSSYIQSLYESKSRSSIFSKIKEIIELMNRIDALLPSQSSDIDSSKSPQSFTDSSQK